MLIRRETEKDREKIYRLVKEAFETAEHSDGNEQDLVNALRESGAFVPELSLVAKIGGSLAGHIMFSKATVGNDTVLVLAPLSVKPEFQRQGVGTALINEAHRLAKGLGYQYSFVLGSELYYPRLGYVPAKSFAVKAPEGIPEANFMAIKLQKDAKAIKGTIKYAEEFGV